MGLGRTSLPTADLRPCCALAGLYSCIELTDWPDVAHVEGMGMAKLKTAEDWPVGTERERLRLQGVRVVRKP